VETRLIPISLRTTEFSDEEVEAEEAVAVLSISWLGLPCGMFSNRAGDASRSLRSISRSTLSMLKQLMQLM
jgi:hypothetical protein